MSRMEGGVYYRKCKRCKKWFLPTKYLKHICSNCRKNSQYYPPIKKPKLFEGLSSKEVELLRKCLKKS